MARTMRCAVLAALVGAAAFAAGCGGDDEPTPDEAARAAAEKFASDLEAGEYESACGEMTQTLVSQLGGNQCPDRISTLAGRAGEDLSITVATVRVSGPKAVAEARVERGSAKQETSFDLQETEGSWEVSALGD